jgi:hypothetical protein
LLGKTLQNTRPLDQHLCSENIPAGGSEPQAISPLPFKAQFGLPFDMTTPALHADCRNCVALCCMALAFDKGAMFAIDKQAGTACPNLGKDHRCTIHSNLKAKGFQGCINYDCEGAGQRVTAMFKGCSWQDDPSLLMPTLEAFHAMRQVHQRLVLLAAAEDLPLDATQKSTLRNLQLELADATDCQPQSQIAKDVQSFLQSLAPLLRGKSMN